MCFVDLEKAFDRVPRGVLWGLLRDYGVPDPLIGAVRSLYDRCQSLVRIAGSKSDMSPGRVGLRQGCPLSPILFIIFMDSISRCSQGVEGVQFGDLRIGSLLTADAVVLLASSGCDLQSFTSYVLRYSLNRSTPFLLFVVSSFFFCVQDRKCGACAEHQGQFESS